MLRTLASLESQWQPYSQGAESFAHGLALPTANSLRGSVVADENVLALRSLTLPPLTQGPYSRTARNISRLGRLTVDGLPVLSQATRWTPTGFLRRASGAWGEVESRLWMPLDENALLLEVNLTASEHGAKRAEHNDDPLVDVELFPEIRKWSRPACTERERRFPTGMAVGCWNWCAPRSPNPRTPAPTPILTFTRALPQVCAAQHRGRAYRLQGARLLGTNPNPNLNPSHQPRPRARPRVGTVPPGSSSAPRSS